MEVEILFDSHVSKNWPFQVSFNIKRILLSTLCQDLTQRQRKTLVVGVLLLSNLFAHHKELRHASSVTRMKIRKEFTKIFRLYEKVWLCWKMPRMFYLKIATVLKGNIFLLIFPPHVSRFGGHFWVWKTSFLTFLRHLKNKFWDN